MNPDSTATPATPTPASPAPPITIDTSALAAEIAARLTAAQVAPSKATPAGHSAPPVVGSPPASVASPASPPVDPRIEQVLAEVAAAKREAIEARRGAGLESWRREALAALTDPVAGPAAVPDAMLALLSAEIKQGDDGRIEFIRDGKPITVLDEQAKAFRPITVAERVAQLRAAAPAGFLAAGAQAAAGTRVAGPAQPAGKTVDLQPAYDALVAAGARITPDAYGQLAELAQARMTAMRSQLGGGL